MNAHGIDQNLVGASAIGWIGQDMQVVVRFGGVDEAVDIKYAVIAPLYQDQWVFVRHKDRDTLELPGGHVEPGETPLDAARRELMEESGAADFDIWPIGVYSVLRGDVKTHGLLCFASVRALGELPPDFEMAERVLTADTPARLTYPDIIPRLMAQTADWLDANATRVYFIRHAQSDQTVRDEAARPLTSAGLQAAAQLPGKLRGVAFDAIYSSPYLRAVQTVTPLAKSRDLPIQTLHELRERRVDSDWIDDYDSFARRQWADHEYKLSDGESIGEVQRRAIAALRGILENSAGKTVAIGTHGGLLGAIRNHYDPSFGYEQFQQLLPKLPCVYRMAFIGEVLIGEAELP